jgi:uncharacterized protein YegL
MASNDFYNGEVPENFEQKCPLAIVPDISGSMAGEPISQLNDGMKDMHTEINGDPTALSKLDTAVISFNSNVTVEQDFSLMDGFTMPQLSAGGTTKLVDGVREAISRIEARKKWYKDQGLAYYRPYIVLVTDGGPDGDQDVDGLAKEIFEGVNNKKFNFWAFGVNGANMDVLKKISHPEFPPQMLKGVSHFKTFFKWLSNSMSAVSNSKPGDKIDLRPKSETSNPFQISI